ncbi:hypothetical protein DK427_22885 [Methylobacterium radiodurans]|uniref:Uncharacterized protein n=2 Tax=Methylobacterium radiodurans TaxID=2202828 RepID=A0A2U8VWN6_9HYPH|nr:hypothetical protein DK427_22885 [Methylobacterium radiodurans]
MHPHPMITCGRYSQDELMFAQRRPSHRLVGRLHPIALDTGTREDAISLGPLERVKGIGWIDLDRFVF